MQELGTVMSVSGKKAQVLIKRHAACGECGKCQIGREKMTMETTALNQVGAKPGQTVHVEMQFINVLTATVIAYGLPLLGFLIGMLIGWYSAPSFGLDQVLTSFSLGLILTAMVYLVIFVLEKKKVFNLKYQPIITEISSEKACQNTEDSL